MSQLKAFGQSQLMGFQQSTLKARSAVYGSFWVGIYPHIIGGTNYIALLLDSNLNIVLGVPYPSNWPAAYVYNAPPNVYLDRTNDILYLIWVASFISLPNYTLAALAANAANGSILWSAIYEVVTNSPLANQSAQFIPDGSVIGFGNGPYLCILTRTILFPSSDAIMIVDATNGVLVSLQGTSAINTPFYNDTVVLNTGLFAVGEVVVEEILFPVPYPSIQSFSTAIYMDFFSTSDAVLSARYLVCQIPTTTAPSVDYGYYAPSGIFTNSLDTVSGNGTFVAYSTSYGQYNNNYPYGATVPSGVSGLAFVTPSGIVWNNQYTWNPDTYPDAGLSVYPYKMCRDRYQNRLLVGNSQGSFSGYNVSVLDSETGTFIQELNFPQLRVGGVISIDQDDNGDFRLLCVAYVTDVNISIPAVVSLSGDDLSVQYVNLSSYPPYDPFGIARSGDVIIAAVNQP